MASRGPADLVRALGTRDGALLTVGAVVGTGIFLTAADVVRALQDPRLVLAVWLVGGLLTLAGALTYAEMGTMFPRAGGLYHFLREAWGPLAGFLYGWTCLLVIMSGGIAAIAVGFGEYLGSFVPPLAGDRTVWSMALPAGVWRVSGAQLAAAAAILALTAANHVGVRVGARLQNGFTLAKLSAMGALILFGLGAAAPSPIAWRGPLAVAPSATLASLGAALIAVLWTYDGWYAVTFTAGEMRDPARSVPRGLLLGMAIVIAIYVPLNWVYLRALPAPELAATSRPAEAAAGALFSADAARFVAAAVVLSAFGCLAATVLYASRIYQPMASDGVFFRRVAAIHPRWRTPVGALWLQGAWAAALALSGGYTQLFTYTTFGGLLFHIATGLALFRLRRTLPDAPRPYRAWGYPAVPVLFVLATLVLTAGALTAAPRESLVGLAAIAAGIPAFAWWRRRAIHLP